MSDEGDNLVSNRTRGNCAAKIAERWSEDRSYPAAAGAIAPRRGGTGGYPRKHAEENRGRPEQSHPVSPVRDRRCARREDSRSRLQVRRARAREGVHGGGIAEAVQVGIECGLGKAQKPGLQARRFVVSGEAFERGEYAMPIPVYASDPRLPSHQFAEHGHLMPLAEADIKELLSFAYMRAIAARAGFRVTQPYPDRQHVDLQIDACGRLEPDGWGEAHLDFQVRARTTIPFAPDGEFAFQIERALYDNLRAEKRCVPLLLAVFIMPPDPDEWLTSSASELITRHCAYWCSLKDAPPIDTDYHSIHINRANLLTTTSLTSLMTIAGRRQEIGNAL